MNPYALSALVLLAIAATAQYFFGTKKNRQITSNISSELELVLKPRDTNYVNIGGSIGYNFTYALSGIWTRAKGTLTVNARHSLLYLPFSLLLGIRDRLFINIFTKKQLEYEAHIVKASYLNKANIAGLAQMQQKHVHINNANTKEHFILLWDSKKDASTKLESLLNSIPEQKTLKHFCVYPETKTFFVYMLPKAGQVKTTLKTIFDFLPNFIVGDETAKVL